MGDSYKQVYAFAREMHPKTVKSDIKYGTAGFRGKATDLGYVMYRMGLLAVLRARYKKGIVGVMITASHNPEPDNGVKIIDPQGEMLEESWEDWATKFANVADDQLEDIIKKIVYTFSIEMTHRVEIFIGNDTRPSSPCLSKCLTDGILALAGKPIDYGIVTTPQLHYFVKCRNTANAYGEPTEKGYYTKLCGAFQAIRAMACACNERRYINRLLFDGANGVGAKKIKYFQELLHQCMNIEMYNDEIIGSGKLNYMCGADYVKTHKQFPVGVPKERNARCCSVDGDADRLIYYYLDDGGQFHLLDGDRIASLVASFFKDLLKETGSELNLGVVQTAYANGASTLYIENVLNIPVSCVSTGVKYLHAKATEHEIGIYFEANGHGTVCIQDKTKAQLKESLEEDIRLTSDQKRALVRLIKLIDIVNETVGDALADMLLVETILHTKGWDCKEWEKCYQDLPNRLFQMTVADRYAITTTDAERVVVTPEGLQKQINLYVDKYNKARAFVRPSGTEDVVRIYVEAETTDQVESLAREILSVVYEMAGGVGEMPEI